MTKQHKHSFGGSVRNAQKNQKRGSGSSNYLNLPKGISLLLFEDTMRKCKLDFLPYVVTDDKHPDGESAPQDSLWYRRPYFIHRSVGADNKSFICLKSIGKKCPICEYQKELFDTDKKAAIALYPKPRYLYIVIPIGSKKHDEVPFVWDMAESLFETELKDSLDENPDNECFPYLEGGKTLECSLKWKTIADGKPFSEVTHITFEDRNDYKEDILDDVPSLDEMLIVLSYDELKDKFFEIDSEEVEEQPTKRTHRGNKEDDDVPPARSTHRVAKESESKEEQYTWKQLEEMSLRKLGKLCSERKLKTDPEDYPEEENKPDFIEAIAIELGIKVPEPEPKLQRSVRADKTSKEEKDRCPFGHKFGIDIDAFKDCKDCKLWDECDDANIKLKSKQ